jgi:mannose-1-phosphate guanylyltransferase
MAGDPLDRLSAVIVLAGTVQPTRSRFSRAVGRMVIDMPLDDQRTILGMWVEQVSLLAERLGRTTLPMRLLLDGKSPALEQGVPEARRTLLSVERDPKDFRGTGGVLADLASGMDPADYLLVVNGRQILLEKLADLAQELARPGADAAVIGHQDGTPSGAMIVRAGAMSVIPGDGFVDMKEQALPRIAREHRVQVVMRDHPTGLSIRTLPDYLNALRMYYRKIQNAPVLDDPFAENLRSTFAIVQDGAAVDASAQLVDSVVLGGGRVEAGAIVVRSVVFSDAVVRRNQRVIDRVVSNKQPATAGETA